MNEKKVIWITGASSGIGKALALKFANEGWIVAASARRENLLQDLNKENSNIHSFPLDVTNIDQCKSVFKNRSEEHTSELQSQSTTSYAVFCLKKKKK